MIKVSSQQTSKNVIKINNVRFKSQKPRQINISNKLLMNNEEDFQNKLMIIILSHNERRRKRSLSKNIKNEDDQLTSLINLTKINISH